MIYLLAVSLFYNCLPKKNLKLTHHIGENKSINHQHISTTFVYKISKIYKDRVQKKKNKKS